MPTCNLVVRVRARQMNQPASGLTIRCAGPTASPAPFEPAHAGGERPCPEMSAAPAAVQPNWACWSRVSPNY